MKCIGCIYATYPQHAVKPLYMHLYRLQTSGYVKTSDVGGSLCTVFHDACCRYIFKRLRFLGNKMVSQCTTLFYLALWHGLDSGYYACFFLEFVYTMCERQVSFSIRLHRLLCLRFVDSMEVVVVVVTLLICENWGGGGVGG